MKEPEDADLSFDDRELIRRVLETMGVQGTPTFAQVETAIRIIGLVAESLVTREPLDGANTSH